MRLCAMLLLGLLVAGTLTGAVQAERPFARQRGSPASDARGNGTVSVPVDANPVVVFRGGARWPSMGAAASLAETGFGSSSNSAATGTSGCGVTQLAATAISMCLACCSCFLFDDYLGSLQEKMSAKTKSQDEPTLEMLRGWQKCRDKNGRENGAYKVLFGHDWFRDKIVAPALTKACRYGRFELMRKIIPEFRVDVNQIDLWGHKTHKKEIKKPSLISALTPLAEDLRDWGSNVKPHDLPVALIKMGADATLQHEHVSALDIIGLQGRDTVLNEYKQLYRGYFDRVTLGTRGRAMRLLGYLGVQVDDENKAKEAASKFLREVDTQVLQDNFFDNFVRLAKMNPKPSKQMDAMIAWLEKAKVLNEDTLLTFSVAQRRSDMVNALVQHYQGNPSKITEKNEFGLSALHIAAIVDPLDPTEGSDGNRVDMLGVLQRAEEASTSCVQLVLRRVVNCGRKKKKMERSELREEVRAIVENVQRSDTRKWWSSLQSSAAQRSDTRAVLLEKWWSARRLPELRPASFDAAKKALAERNALRLKEEAKGNLSSEVVDDEENQLLHRKEEVEETDPFSEDQQALPAMTKEAQVWKIERGSRQPESLQSSPFILAAGGSALSGASIFERVPSQEDPYSFQSESQLDGGSEGGFKTAGNKVENDRSSFQPIVLRNKLLGQSFKYSKSHVD